MKKLLAFGLLLAFLMGLFGCSGFRYLDSSSDNELTEFECLERIRTSKLTPEEQRMQQIAKLSLEQERLREELSTVKGELRTQKEMTLEQGTEPETVVVTAKALPTAKTASLLKIKVLSGNGKISSAASMRARLQNMGYKVQRIDLAPRATFKADTVYYSRKYQEEARALAVQIGGNTELRPLTWNTNFDIIVVSIH